MGDRGRSGKVAVLREVSIEVEVPRLSTNCCDMRKGFNGLYGLVSSSFGENPRSGALYVFCNRRHTRIKVLYFDGTGLWVLEKSGVVGRRMIRLRRMKDRARLLLWDYV
jgi:transposase